jgi:hypothetical protein
VVAVAAPPVDPCRRRRRRARRSPSPRPCGGFTVSLKTRSGRERLVTVALCSPFCARLLRSPSAAALGPSHHRDSRHIADRLGARVAPVAPRVVPVAPRVVPVAPTCGPSVPLGAFHGATGTATVGRLGPFPKGDWALHTGDSAHTGGDSRNRLSAPGAATRRGDCMGQHREKRRLAGGRATTRRRESPAGRVPLGGASGSSPLPCAPPLPVRPLPIIPPSLTNRNMTVL